MDKRYSKCLLKQIKDNKKLYYILYNISILISYISIILFSWYFINLAYTTEVQNYDILCFNCTTYKYIIFNFIIYFALFNLIFYIINEVRFRLLYFKITRKISLDIGNRFVFCITLLFFILLIIYI